jgi:hypothetical protein
MRRGDDKVMMLTIAECCEDTENFNDWSDRTEAIVESIDDDRISIDLSSRVISSEIFEWNQ